jgi:hypothetical protein
LFRPGDCVAVIVAGETQFEGDRVLAPRALHRMLALLHRTSEGFGSGPERGGQAAFGGERADDAAMGDVVHQAERAVETRLAAAVRTGDDGEATERNRQVAQRTIAGNRDLVDHPGTLPHTFGRYLCQRALWDGKSFVEGERR